MRDLEAFFQSTQKRVSGSVFIELHPYRYQILGIESPNDLMSDKFGAYGEMNKTWSGEDVKGFTKIIGNQTAIYHQLTKAWDEN